MSAADPPASTTPPDTERSPPSDFIREQVRADLADGTNTAIVTRFPPEPNGYLHLGHALSICLNFSVAQEFAGQCNLRFDDTNPVKEEQEFIEAIQRDVNWLGFSWSGEPKYASDNFQQLYDWAEYLINVGSAYIDDLSAEEIRQYRGTLTEPGKPSPYRGRPTKESLDLFRRMKAGEFPDGARVLRAKIDMASGNLNLRDPILYRILRATHPRTGDDWCLYPTYDFAHGQCDAIEGVTHSLCTLEFADHRPLYDWMLDALPVPAVPRQYEFAKLSISHTVLSKRRLTRLVAESHVKGWDDPRMATLSGMRRRGVPAAALRDFIARLSVSKNEGKVEMAMLEHVIRETLNQTAERRMAVLRPLKVVITNYPEGETDWLEAINNPNDPDAGNHKLPFSRELWVERDDFMEDPPKKFFRLGPGREVRLRYAFFITCNEVIKNADGEVTELQCTYDPLTRGGDASDGRKVKGTIHWVSVEHARTAEIRLYTPLYNRADPGADGDFVDDINPDSLEVLSGCKLEPSLDQVPAGTAIQFERTGYFVTDPDGTPDAPVYNRTVALRDSWAKAKAKG
jgi:glutaminyl-tRNA synthetase